MRRIATLIAPLGTFLLNALPFAAAGVEPQQVAEARSEAPPIHSSAELADYLRRHPDDTRLAAFSPGARARFIDQLNFRDGHLVSFSTEDLGELTRSQGDTLLRLLGIGDLVDHLAILWGSLVANKHSQTSAIDQHYNALIKSDLATDKNTLSSASQTPLWLDALASPARASRLDTYDLRLLIRAALRVSENTPNSTALKVTTTALGQLGARDAIDPLSRTQAMQVLLINHDFDRAKALATPGQTGDAGFPSIDPAAPTHAPGPEIWVQSAETGGWQRQHLDLPPPPTDTGDRRMPFLNGRG